MAVMSGAQIFMAEDLGISDAQVEVLSGVISIYSLAGALLAGWTSDRLGRRLTIVLANVFFLAGPLAMALAGGYVRRAHGGPLRRRRRLRVRARHRARLRRRDRARVVPRSPHLAS